MPRETLEHSPSLSKDPTPDWTRRGLKWEEADGMDSDDAHLQRE